MSTSVTLPITIRGETRDVEFRLPAHDWETMLSAAPVGAFQKRSGQKVWAERLRVWREKDGPWKLNPQATILNRAGYRLVGWADKVVPVNPSKHNSAHEVQS